MANLGAHVSTAGGLVRAFERAQTATCNVIQLFVKNQRQWQAKPLTPAEIADFRSAHSAWGGGPLIVHDSYLINLGSSDPALWQKSLAAFSDELERCAALGIPALVTHPGAHVGAGEATGLENVGRALRHILDNAIGGEVRILLETTAGQGTTLGARFEHLARLIELTDGHERIGVCFDTCHALAAGYDFRTAEGYAATMGDFERLIGLERLQAFHLNDSKGDVGSHLDRHTHIGDGHIGLAGFAHLMRDPRFAAVPMVLETPKEPDESADLVNLQRLRDLRTPPVETQP